jgi:ABC-type methionine transport system permease subunit
MDGRASDQTAAIVVVAVFVGFCCGLFLGLFLFKG